MDIPTSERRTKLYESLVSNATKCDATKCWIWQKGDSGNGRGGGYGRIYYEGQMIAVHRAMFIVVHGYIHRHLQIDHICGNRRCLNPDHLEAVTHKENQKRRDERKKAA